MKRIVAVIIVVAVVFILLLVLSYPAPLGRQVEELGFLDLLQLDGFSFLDGILSTRSPSELLGADFGETLILVPATTPEELAAIDAENGKQPLQVYVERASGPPLGLRLARIEWLDASGKRIGKDNAIELVLDRVEEHQLVYKSRKPVLLVGSPDLEGDYPFGTVVYALPETPGKVTLLDH